MSEYEETYHDFNGNVVKVGDRVKFGVDEDAIGIVSHIRESDADHNDDTGRTELIPPRLFVKYDDGLTDYCDGATDYDRDDPFTLEFHFDDIELVVSS